MGKHFALIDFAATVADECEALPFSLELAQQSIAEVMRDSLDQLNYSDLSFDSIMTELLELLCDKATFPKIKEGETFPTGVDLSCGFTKQSSAGNLVHVIQKPLLAKFDDASKRSVAKRCLEDLKRSPALLRDGVSDDEYAKPITLPGRCARPRQLTFSRRALQTRLKQLQ